MKFDLRKFLEIVGKVGPVVLAAVPGGDKIAPIIPKVIEAIGEAEQIRGASGADKKAHVLNIVRASVDVANTSGRLKLNAGEIEGIASQGIDTVIATVHVIEGAKVTKGGASSSTTAAGAGAASSLPGVDTAPRASDLPGGHATHGHGSADNIPQGGTTRAAAEGKADAAPASDTPAPGVNDGNRPASDPPSMDGKPPAR